MIPTTPTLKTAIASSSRQPVTQVLLWINGDTAAPVDFSYLRQSVAIDRTPQDTSEYVSQFAGSIAAQATVVLDWVGDSVPGGDGLSKSRDFAPYVGTLTSFLALDYGIGVKVQILQGFVTSVGAETVSVFVGRIDSVAVTDEAAVTLHCLDSYANLLAQVDLPSTATAPPVSVLDTSGSMPTYMVVEHLLRSGGFYRTPPPLPGCVLSVPVAIPEIGDASPVVLDPSQYNSGQNSRYAAPYFDNRYLATQTYAPLPGTAVVVEGWFKSSTLLFGAGARTLVTLGADSTIAPNDGLMVQIQPDGRVFLTTIIGAGGLATQTQMFPTDNNWHYLYAEMIHNSDGTTMCTVMVDATVTTRTMSGLQVPDNGSRTVIIGGLVHEGVSVRYPRAAGFTTVTRAGWTPNYNAVYLGTSPTITAIPRGQSGTVTDLLRGIATATGAVYRFTEDGTWRWEDRDSWVARRFQPPVADYDDTRALNASGYSYNAASRRGSVTIDWAEYAPLRSTVAAPAWQATTESIVARAQRTDSIDIQTATPITGIQTPNQSSVAGTTYSSFQVVPAYQVGDPAARIVGNVIVSVTPTATGFTVIVTNRNNFDVALWDPATGNPALSLQGWTITGGDPRTYTMGASPRSMEALTMNPSPWRQSRTSAAAMCDAIAADVAVPAVVFDNQQVVSDPSLTVDDIIRVKAPAIMTGLVPVQIVGMSYTDTEQVLTVRACYAPTGWVLDVPGRSELDSTTILVA